MRYRIYTLIVILILAPLLYASDKNIPDNIQVLSFRYEENSKNVLATEIKKIPNNLLTFGSGFENNSQPNSNQEDPKENPTEEEVFYDVAGQIITNQLKKYANIDLGFISSENLKLEGIDLSIAEEEPPLGAQEKPTSLDDIIPRPTEGVEVVNMLEYPDYNIYAPIVYADFDDLFERDAEGNIDFQRPKDTDGTDSPVQKKLEQGIVHLAYTPQPGEIGNSYIVGHSSNFSFVNSPYNTIFKPIQEKSKPGEVFYIYDRYGRRLKFEVFEAIKIADNETVEAFKNFGGEKRIVTLQTSVLGIRNGRWEATHRWLTRGELVVS